MRKREDRLHRQIKTQQKRWLFNKVEPSKIVFSPASSVEHPGKRLDNEGIGSVMGGNGDVASIGMFVAVMASFDAGLGEAVVFESADKRFRIHAAGNFQTVTSTAGDSTSRIAASGGDGFPFVAHLVQNELHRFANPLQGFFPSIAPSVSAFERRTGCRETGPPVVKLIFLDDNFKNVAFQGVLLGQDSTVAERIKR